MGKAKLKGTSLDKDLCRTATEVCACFNLRKASRAVTQVFDQCLQPTGLRSTQFVLLAVLYVNEPVNVALLARELVTERTTLLRNLRPLKSAKLVQNEQSLAGAAHMLRLTDAGKQRVSAAIPYWQQAQQQFTERFGASNWSSMLSGLSAAADAARLA